MQRHQKSVAWVLTGLVATLLMVAWYFMNFSESESPVSTIEIKVPLKSSKAPVSPIVFVQHPLAIELAESLNNPEKSPQDDLQAVAQILYSFRQSFRENPIGQNDDVTAALLGENEKHILFLTKDTAHVKDGRLVDRWGTPYWFHPLSGQKMELRSAGPDHEMFTPDDVVLE